MARGALRGALTAAFGLTVLQVAVSRGGSSKIAGAVDVVNGVVQHAFDSKTPAIPDRRTGGGSVTPPAPGTGAVATGAAAAVNPFRTIPVPTN